MNFSKVFEENSNEVNRLVAKQLRFVLVLIFFVWILNVRDIFIISSDEFNFVMLVSAIFLLLPTVLVDILELQHAMMKYILIFCAISFVSILYMYLTYHAVIMFMFPIVIASLYFDNKLTLYTVICTLAALVASHIGSYYLSLMTDDPFHSFYDIMVYGLLPRSIGYVALSAIVIMLTKRTSQLFQSFITYSDDIKQSRDSLDVIVSNTNSFFQAKNAKELSSVVFTACKCFVSIHAKIKPCYKAFFAMADNRGKFTMFGENLKSQEVQGIRNRLKVSVDGKEVVLPYFQDEHRESIYIQDGLLIMTFYENNCLNAFFVMENEFEDKVAELMKRELMLCYGNLKLAISNNRLSREMYETQEELVRAFAEISESKSKQTGQHIKRVSEYMRIMAKAIKLPEREQDNLVIASMMHDIGKLMISPEIIEKKGKLTEEEFAEIKKHVHYGFELLKYSPGHVMEIAKTIALQHHEKWNGKGYLGIKGEEIDYYSRIMAVVDVFDALISKRSYKEKWSLEDAYDEIVSQSGEHFDPAVVTLFQEHFEELKEVVEKYPD